MRRRRFRWSNLPLNEAHVAGFGLGLVLTFVKPWHLFTVASIGHVVGWPLVLAGLSVVLWGMRTAQDLELDRPAELVTRGPWAVIRNPMYAAATLVYLGAAFVANIAWPLVFLPAVLLVTHLEVLGEERRLDAQFGDGYRRYAAQVPRYLGRSRADSG